jgi:hypothetical protein
MAFWGETWHGIHQKSWRARLLWNRSHADGLHSLVGDPCRLRKLSLHLDRNRGYNDAGYGRSRHRLALWPVHDLGCRARATKALPVMDAGCQSALHTGLPCFPGVFHVFGKMKKGTSGAGFEWDRRLTWMIALS